MKMKVRISERRNDEWLVKLKIWHKYFAWYPVKIEDHWVWMETVERKCRHYSTFAKVFTWDYRLVPNKVVIGDEV